MDTRSLRRNLIRLAHGHPQFRDRLLPLYWGD